MGSAASKPKDVAVEVCQSTKKQKLSNQSPQAKITYDEEGDENQVNEFINKMINSGNKNDIITSMLNNTQSRNYFIEYLKQEFQNEKLVIKSWQVFLHYFHIMSILYAHFVFFSVK
jgi:cell fate regulator YaaT (PSP1 superfamily)